MKYAEKTLLSRCLNGENAAWDAFLLHYSSLIYYTIKKTLLSYRFSPEPHVIEDLYQEFCLSLVRNGYAKLCRFQGLRGCSLASWLSLLAHRLTIDFLRMHKRTVSANFEAIAAEGPDFTALLIAREEKARLSQALRSLSPRERALVALFYEHGLRPAKIAAILRTSVAAVYTQKNRLLHKLKARLKECKSL